MTPKSGCHSRHKKKIWIAGILGLLTICLAAAVVVLNEVAEGNL